MNLFNKFPEYSSPFKNSYLATIFSSLLPILEEALTPPCYKPLAFKNKLIMCSEININVHHNEHSFQLRQKNFTVE